MIETLGSLALAAGHDLLGEVRSDSLESPRTPLSRVFDMEASYTGKSVSEIGSLSLTTVFGCVRVIAGSIAKTPLITYRRLPGVGKELAPDHYLYDLLRHRANPYMSAFRFKRLMQAWALLWGNAYAEMVISGRGQVIELWPWRPDRVRPSILGRDMVYTYTMADGQPVSLPSSHVFHLRGLEVDGFMGVSPIQVARQSIGLGLAAEEYGARFFGNNGRPGMVLEHPDKLSDLARQNLIASWESLHKGLQGAHRVGILEEGMKLHEVGIPPEDAQFLQTRKFQTVEICRLFGVPPHKIAELERSTNNNIEHQGLEFVQDSLGDWFANWEQEIAMSMLSEREHKSIMVGFDPSDLLRGDLKSTAEALGILRQNGFINSNDGRGRIGMNPIPDELGGNKYLVNAAFTDLAEVGEEPDANVHAVNSSDTEDNPVED
jgi:HK97 family phage portal protein